MTNPRFTIAAGVLGMSLCGLAAIANSSGKAGSPLGCYRSGEPGKLVSPETQATEPYQVALKVVSDPPVDIPPVSPPLIELPNLEKPTPPPPTIPLIPQNTVVPPLLPTIEPAQLAIPKLPETTVVQSPPSNLIVPEIKTAPQAAAKPEVVMLELPAPTPTPTPTNVIPQATGAVIPPLTRAVEPTANPEGIKIIVQMNNGRPSLTILSDNAEMMTLTCEQLDLAARSPGDETVSGIKASGKVTFTAPGCQGSCDELLLNPKSWDGTMLKNVKAKCTNGNSGTELAADKMTFKLRSPRELVVPTIPTSHNTPTR
jgi:hypothetical protein